MAGLTEIPCIIMNMTDQESTLVALVENLQRKDLDFVEEAEGIARLIQLQNLSQDQAAKLLGKSQSAIANKLRLLRHSPQVLQALREGGLTERHGRALLRLGSEEEKLRAIAYILRQNLSVAKTEEYIDALLQSGKESRRRTIKVGNFLNSLTNSLSKIRESGICVVSQRVETDEEIRLTITIPK